MRTHPEIEGVRLHQLRWNNEGSPSFMSFSLEGCSKNQKRNFAAQYFGKKQAVEFAVAFPDQNFDTIVNPDDLYLCGYFEKLRQDFLSGIENAEFIDVRFPQLLWVATHSPTLEEARMIIKGASCFQSSEVTIAQGNSDGSPLRKTYRPFADRRDPDRIAQMIVDATGSDRIVLIKDAPPL